MKINSGEVDPKIIVNYADISSPEDFPYGSLFKQPNTMFSGRTLSCILDSDAWKRTLWSHHRRPVLHLEGRLHPPLHVLQLGADPTSPAYPLSQRRRLHHVHDLLRRQQWIPGVYFVNHF